MPEPRRRSSQALARSMLEPPLDYCSRGWPVLPCDATRQASGGCARPKWVEGREQQPGRVAGGLKAEPEANIGLVTGIALRREIDIDGDDGYDRRSSGGTLVRRALGRRPDG